MGYKGLQRVTGVYKGLQGVRRGFKGLHALIIGYMCYLGLKGLQR